MNICWPLLRFARRIQCRRFASSARSKKNPPSSLLTHHLNVEPKNFERELWAIYDSIEEHPWTTQEKLTEIRQSIFDLKRMKKEIGPILNRQKDLRDKVSELTAKLKEEGSEVDEDLKRLTLDLEEATKEATPKLAALENIEDGIFDQVVFFPNCRPSAGTGEQDQVILSGGERRHFSFPVKSHVDFESDVVFRSDVGPESTYYLQNKAVEAEFAIVDHFENALLEADFLPFGSMPDIISAAPAIACGSSPDDLIPINDSYFDDDDDDNNGGRPGRRKRRKPRFLTGGSSLYTFSAFFSQLMFRTGRANTGIPLRLFSIGRNYRLVDFDQRHPSLFNCIQSTRLSLFGVPHLQKSDEMFDDYSQFLASIYVELGLPFQMVEVGKENLCRSESRRHEVRLWSPDEERYIVCASVSHHNDYIANRLLSFQRRSNTYPCQFISGVAVDVAVLLAAAMENGQQEDGSWAWPEICD